MKIRLLFAAAAAAAILALPASALTLRMDGQERTTYSRAVLIDDTTYVSLRAVSALLHQDARVSWQDGTAAVTADGLALSARPGDPYIRANDRCIHAPAGVRLINGVTMVPLRALAAAMGGTVTWDSASQTAFLTTGSGLPAPASYGEDDLYWLARIISAESRGEPLQGKIAVGTVVLNRVESSAFPDTIKDVIFDSRWGGQFEPVRNGTVYDTPTEESVIAAKLCLEGARAAGESLYFLAPDLTKNHWIMDNRTYVTTIGCHWFYR